MVTADELAQAALSGDNLALRSVAQDLLRTWVHLQDCPPPESSDAKVRSVAAGLLELLAQRLKQAPPIWTATIGPAPEKVNLVADDPLMQKYLNRLSEAELPSPLWQRQILAPPDFLSFA